MRYMALYADLYLIIFMLQFINSYSYVLIGCFEWAALIVLGESVPPKNETRRLISRLLD